MLNYIIAIVIWCTVFSILIRSLRKHIVYMDPYLLKLAYEHQDVNPVHVGIYNLIMMIIASIGVIICFTVIPNIMKPQLPYEYMLLYTLHAFISIYIFWRIDLSAVVEVNFVKFTKPLPSMIRVSIGAFCKIVLFIVPSALIDKNVVSSDVVTIASLILLIMQCIPYVFLGTSIFTGDKFSIFLSNLTNAKLRYHRQRILKRINEGN